MAKKSSGKGHQFHARRAAERAAFRAFCERQKLRAPRRKGWGPMTTLGNGESNIPPEWKADWQDTIDHT